MTTVQTKDLIGPALDWAVAKAENVTLSGASLAFQMLNWGGVCTGSRKYSPSSNWSQGGPIIGREGLSFRQYHNPKNPEHDGTWYAKKCRESNSMIQWHRNPKAPHPMYSGPTPLIAAMRCYVASRLGDSVDVPEELIL